MVENILYAFLAVLIVTLLSLVGIVTFIVKSKSFDQIIHYLLPFSIGTLISVTFFELLPEAVILAGGTFRSDIGFLIIISMGIAFLLEKFVHWHHHIRHEDEISESEVVEVKLYVYNILYGDAIHNFIDGIALVVAFNISIGLGVTIFLGVAIHELAQEFGDFAILVKGGYSPKKALIYNLLSGLTSFLGAIIGIFLLNYESLITELNIIILSLTAGTFIYLSTADLIPELAEELSMKKTLFHLLTGGFGVILIFSLTLVENL
jgi:zinc and cadmium transporter